MNQAIRERFYRQGNKHHVEYIIRVSGMSEQEAELFRMLHDGADDLLVESTMYIDRKRRTQLEKMVAPVILSRAFCASTRVLNVPNSIPSRLAIHGFERFPDSFDMFPVPFSRLRCFRSSLTSFLPQLGQKL